MNNAPMEQEEQPFFAESRQQFEQYVQDRLLLVKMQMVEKLSQIVAPLFSGLLIALLAFFILLFMSIMAGYFFAAITNSLYVGFGIVALFYIVFLLTIIKLRKKVIEKTIINTVIKIFFTNNDAEEENK